MTEDHAAVNRREEVQQHLSDAFRPIRRESGEDRVQLLIEHVMRRINAMTYMQNLCRRELDHADNRLLHGRIPEPPSRRPERPYRLKKEENEPPQQLCRKTAPARMNLPPQRAVDMLGRYERFLLL